jgi:hypothetical protein
VRKPCALTSSDRRRGCKPLQRSTRTTLDFFSKGTRLLLAATLHLFHIHMASLSPSQQSWKSLWAPGTTLHHPSQGPPVRLEEDSGNQQSARCCVLTGQVARIFGTAERRHLTGDASSPPTTPLYKPQLEQIERPASHSILATVCLSFSSTARQGRTAG